MNILLVEDRPEDAFVIQKQLRHEAGELPLEIEHVETLGAALERVQHKGLDCVLLDLGLPDGRGLNNLRRLQGVAPDLPIVILSGIEDERTAASAVQTGAFAYIVKRPIGQSEALIPVLQDAIAANREEPASLKPISNEGRFSLDSDQVIRTWDERCEAILHWEEEDILGRSLYECVPASRREELVTAFGNTAKLIEPLKLHMLLPNQKARLVEIRPSNDKTEDGNRIWLLADAETSRRSLQAMQVLDLIMETVSDAVFSQDLEGTIHSCSRSTVALTGREMPDIIGTNFSALFPASARQSAESILLALKRGRVIRDLDFELQGPGDTQIPVTLTLAPLRDEYGGLIGACTIATRREAPANSQSAALREKLRLEEINSHLQDEITELRDELRTLRRGNAPSH